MFSFNTLVVLLLAVVTCQAMTTVSTVPSVKRRSQIHRRLSTSVERGAGGIACDEGAPANVTTDDLGDGTQVTSWHCKSGGADEERKGIPVRKVAQPFIPMALPDHERQRRVGTSQACGLPCTTYCYSGAGGGPNNGDCYAMATTLKASHQNYVVGVGAVSTTAVNGSCAAATHNYNKDLYLSYCYKDVGGIVDYITANCGAAQGAHGGYCLFENDWSVGAVSVEHS
jgi:hypothetical protein